MKVNGTKGGGDQDTRNEGAENDMIEHTAEQQNVPQQVSPGRQNVSPQHVAFSGVQNGDAECEVDMQHFSAGAPLMSDA